MEVADQGEIIRDPGLHCAMPSIILTGDNRFLCAFRQAPDRRSLGRPRVHHCDTNAYIYLCQSQDGKTWTEPRLLYAHPLGGCQDPCLFETHHGTLLCSSYGYVLVEQDYAGSQQQLHYSNYYFLGGFLLRSEDGGKTWSQGEPLPRLSRNGMHDYSRETYRPFNRGSLVQNPDGRIYYAATRHNSTGKRGVIELFVSDDDGISWSHHATIADAAGVSLNETSLVISPDGVLRAFIRSVAQPDYLFTAHSLNPEHSEFSVQRWRATGHPWHASVLQDGRLVLVSGYRNDDNQIHARVLSGPDYQVPDEPDLVIRQGGGNWDIGYPWSVVMPDNSILVVYYWNENDGERHIAWARLTI